MLSNDSILAKLSWELFSQSGNRIDAKCDILKSMYSKGKCLVKFVTNISFLSCQEMKSCISLLPLHLNTTLQKKLLLQSIDKNVAECNSQKRVIPKW